MPPRKRTTPARPRKAAPKPVVVPVDSDDAFDLASIFATEPLPPEPITFLGVTGHVRREFTGAEVVEFSVVSSNISKDGNVARLLDLVTDVGPELWAKVSPLSPQHATQILNKIVEMTGLSQGKLFAPLVASSPPRAGAPVSPGSDASTG